MKARKYLRDDAVGDPAADFQSGKGWASLARLLPVVHTITSPPDDGRSSGALRIVYGSYSCHISTGTRYIVDCVIWVRHFSIVSL